MLVDDNPDPKPKMPQKRAGSLSNACGHSRYPSPALSMTSTAQKHTGERDTNASLARSRSRSLSVSLAHDADARRAGSVGVGTATKKRALNSEVSMSRVFKDKPVKTMGGGKTKSTSTSKATMDLKPQGQAGQGVTLVEATPVKGPRRAQLQRASLLTSTKISQSPTPGRAAGDIEEEDWSFPSSPDVLSAKAGGTDERPFGDAGQILAGDTPVKNARRSFKVFPQLIEDLEPLSSREI
jgi:hypothetical protein